MEQLLRAGRVIVSRFMCLLACVALASLVGWFALPRTRKSDVKLQEETRRKTDTRLVFPPEELAPRCQGTRWQLGSVRELSLVPFSESPEQ